MPGIWTSMVMTSGDSRAASRSASSPLAASPTTWRPRSRLRTSGDDILRLAARTLHGAVQAIARPDSFVGHVGGDDFVAITPEEAAKAVVEDLIERFDLEVPSLYDPEDAERGWIEVENRRRQLERFPLVTISVGVASTATRRFGHYAEAVATATEMKSLAKQQPGSSWAADRRVG